MRAKNKKTVPFQIVAIGSTNAAKVGAVKNALPDIEVIAQSVPSGISAQPLSDEETLTGAKNRAHQVLATISSAQVGIGLEGGVQITPAGLFLCNWGALTDGVKTYIAGGARIPLPPSMLAPLQSGIELGDLMDQYAAKKNVRQTEGAIGIFTEGWLNRQEVFVPIVKMLVGQYLHSAH